MNYKVTSTSAKATVQLGKKLARYLKRGDVLLLKANLGAGKTTFAQGVAQGLGVSEEAISPTFTIAQTLEGRLPFHHIDFYRLKKAEVLGIGIQDYMAGGGEIEPGVVFIEWADICPEIWPADKLLISLVIKKNSTDRAITFNASGKRSKELLLAFSGKK